MSASERSLNPSTQHKILNLLKERFGVNFEIKSVKSKSVRPEI